MSKLTPMMQQYFEIKENYRDCILLFRLGDFYEMFFDDAIVASKVLEITLTGRDCGLDERAPMCGVPHHSANNYIAKLIENGYKVAICEQMQDPSEAKGIVKRDVVRVITPGTIIDQNMLDDKSNNYLCSICTSSKGFGFSYVDVSTGELFVSEYISNNDFNDTKSAVLYEEISKISPSEIILNIIDGENILAEKYNINANHLDKILSFNEYKNMIKKHFNVISLDTFGISDNNLTIISLGMLLNYLYNTQKTSLEHINKIQFYCIGDYLQIDSNTRRNLELIETMRGKKGQGTLYWVLDNTTTAMGGRLLRKWIEQPLKNKIKINNRLDAIEELFDNVLISNNIKEHLKKVYDIERLIGRIVYGNCNGRDLTALKQSIFVIPDIKSDISVFKSDILCNIYNKIDSLNDIYKLLDISIVNEPPISIKEGGIIKSGYNSELDELREISSNGKDWITNLQNSERERTKIKNLKIGYNKVFGYYIEVTKSNIKYVPEEYLRKQTLSNCERFVTPELKEMESKVLNAEEQIMKLEYDIFLQIRQYVKEQVKRIQKSAHYISIIDVLNSLAISALKNNYTRPSINDNGYIKIKSGRHPVIERISTNEMFVPNDTYIDDNEFRVSVITGPNMAGKSTYMRQVALITLLAHIGSYVPANEADICILDKIFTRVGASDDLSQGQSTFMVEMAEVSNILNNATKNSLLILDEIGRGTSTYDGLSIAWAVTEYITEKIKSKTLFATHYHELSELEDKIEGIKNYKILIKESGENIIFLRKIAAGSADRSYGIQVANLAGLPSCVINRAKSILEQLEENDLNKSQNNIINKDLDNNLQLSLFDNSHIYKKFIEDNILNLNINNFTPIDALNKLNELIENYKKLR